MTVTLPDDLMNHVGLTEADIKREIAVLLFSRNNISMGKAKELAGMTQLSFQRLLASRQIPIHYGIEELDEDIATLKKLGLM